MKWYRHVSIVLCASAIGFCYALFFAGRVTFSVYKSMIALGKGSLSDLQFLCPAITRFAMDHTWVFMVPIILVCPAATFRCRTDGNSLRCLVLGLGSQAIVFWAALFCYCYAGFLSWVSMHHGQTFEISEFLSVGWGVFPVTLAAVLFPMLVVLLSRDHQKSSAL